MRRRRDGQRQDRRVGGIDLVVDRRLRQVVGQQVAGGVDRGLHFLLGDLDRLVEREPQRDDRGAARTGGRHLVEPGHLAELALERRGDRARHHLRARARIEREHPDGRVVHLRQRRDRQQPIGEQPRQQQRRHQQRRGDGPEDERARDVHGVAPSAGARPGRGCRRRGPDRATISTVAPFTAGRPRPRARRARRGARAFGDRDPVAFGRAERRPGGSSPCRPA